MDGRLKDERLMQRATTLLSKAFLHHLHHLLALPSFPQLWLRALELLEQYYKSPNNELLLDLVPETLKNMLLVMGTSRVFETHGGASADGTTLGEATRRMVASISPQLLAHEEVNELLQLPGAGTAPAPAASDATPEGGEVSG